MRNLATLSRPLGIWMLVLISGVTGAQTTNPSPLPITEMPANWQQLSLPDLTAAVQTFTLATKDFSDANTTEVRTQIALNVWNQYLGNNQQFQGLSASDQDDVFQLIGFVGSSLTPAIMPLANQTLVAIANNSASLAAMNFTLLRHLSIAIQYTGGVSKATWQSVAVNWVNASNQWQSLNAEELPLLGTWLNNGTSAAASNVQQEILSYAWANFLSQSAFYTGTKFTRLNNFIRMFGSQYDASNQAIVLTDLLQRYQNSSGDLSAVSIQSIHKEVSALAAVGATDQQKAQIVVQWALARDQRAIYTVDDGGPSRQYLSLEELARGTSNPQAFAGAIESAIQSNGLAGPTSIKLLAAMKLSIGDLPAWSTQLDGLISSPSVAGDALANLLIAKGTAVEMLDPKHRKLRALTWGQQALAAAQSDNMRLSCTEWIVRRVATKRDYATVNTYIQNLLGQAQNPQVIQQLNVLAEMMNTKETIEGNLTTLAAAKATTQAQLLQGQLTYLQAQLAQAIASDRPDGDIQALQTLVGNVQQQLSQTTATTVPSPVTAQ
jgi:hypothetical protein